MCDRIFLLLPPRSAGTGLRHRLHRLAPQRLAPPGALYLPLHPSLLPSPSSSFVSLSSSSHSKLLFSFCVKRVLLFLSVYLPFCVLSLYSPTLSSGGRLGPQLPELASSTPRCSIFHSSLSMKYVTHVLWWWRRGGGGGVLQEVCAEEAKSKR